MIFKRWLDISLIIALGIFLSSSLTAHAASPTITGANVAGGAGETVSYDVSITGNPGISGYMVYVEWDKDVLVYREEGGSYSVTTGSFSDSGTILVNTDNGSNAKILWFSTSDSALDGSLFAITLTILPDASAGTYPITIGYSPENTVNAEGELQAFETVNGSITVTGTDTEPPPPANPGEPEKPEIPNESAPNNPTDTTVSKPEVPAGQPSDNFSGNPSDTPPLPSHSVVSTDPVIPVSSTEKPGTGTQSPGNANNILEETLEITFLDVPQTHWAYSYISALAGQGIVSGMGDSLFLPEDHVTRAQFVKILAGIVGADISGYTTAGFSDVSDTAWYMPYVAWAKERGVVNGVDGGKNFAPDVSITREQIAAILYRMTESEHFVLPQKNGAVRFTDSGEISGYAQEAVSALQQAGVIGGMTDGSFKPRNNATRAEAAKMLYVTQEIMKGE